MSRSYVMMDLDDPRAAKLAEIMSNSTCKKMLSLLADHDLSESELAHRLSAPLNTINYNMKKLVGAGLAEPVRSLWSAKGRAVKVYRISQKKIVISPKTLLKGVIPALIITMASAFGIRTWELSRIAPSDSLALASEKSVDVALPAVSAYAAPVTSGIFSHFWLWFLLGACVSMSVLFLWNWLRD